MEKLETIKILEALALGCSPKTGELLDNESVLNEREVIRALQIAIYELKHNKIHNSKELIDKNEIIEAINLFQKFKVRPTYKRMVDFFLGNKKFLVNAFNTNSLYGKYNDKYKKGELTDYFSEYFKSNYIKRQDDEPWEEVDFFRKPIFNNLSESAVNQLKGKINEIGIKKTEDLSDHIIKSRTTYFRAYETWSEKEIELLTKAVKYTNDLSILTECFQRGEGSIKACGKKIIFNNHNN